MAILMKAGDTAPIVRAALLDEFAAPVNLTGASVKFVMAASGDKMVAVDAVATIEEATDGIVTYAWAVGDTDDAGSYVAEFEVTFVDASVQTFPTQGYIDVTIEEDLGGTV